MNSPAKGSRFCIYHQKISITFVDEYHLMSNDDLEPPKKRLDSEEEDQAVVKILESKEVYGTTFHKVSVFDFIYLYGYVFQREPFK